MDSLSYRSPNPGCRSPYVDALIKAVKSPRSILKKTALMAIGDVFEFAPQKVHVSEKLVSAAHVLDLQRTGATHFT